MKVRSRLGARGRSLRNVRHWVRRLCYVAASAMPLLFGHAMAAGWYVGEIQTVQLNQNGGIFVWLTAASGNNECGSTRVDYVLNNESTGKSILAALLSWQAQNRAASFYIDNCEAGRGKFTDVKNAN
jgi:hypothetical protein